MKRRPPRSTFFPYPTLFRSLPLHRDVQRLPRLEAAEGVRAERRHGLGRQRRQLAELLPERAEVRLRLERHQDRKSTRLNSSHANISYAVFCLKKKKKKKAVC